MKEIYVQLGKEYKKNFLKILGKEFQIKGIRIWEIPEEEERCNLKEKQRLEHALILTDQKETAKWAVEDGIACVAYEPEGAEYHFSQVDMVIQDFTPLNTEFFHLVYKRHYGLPWTIVETDRLLIRESIMEDFEDIYGIYQEPGMTDYMTGISGTKEEEREFLNAYIHSMYGFFGYGLWTVIEKKSGAVIGRAGLENAAYRGEPVLELGYMISTHFQRKGYGLEAVRALCTYAREAVGTEQIYVFIEEENQRSLHLMEKMGAREIETDRPQIRVFLLEV